MSQLYVTKCYNACQHAILEDKPKKSYRSRPGLVSLHNVGHTFLVPKRFPNRPFYRDSEYCRDSKYCTDKTCTNHETELQDYRNCVACSLNNPPKCWDSKAGKCKSCKPPIKSCKKTDNPESHYHAISHHKIAPKLSYYGVLV